MSFQPYIIEMLDIPFLHEPPAGESLCERARVASGEERSESPRRRARSKSPRTRRAGGSSRKAS